MRVDQILRACLGPRGALLLLLAFLLPLQASNAASNAADDYRVGPGDLLRIGVFGYPDLAGDVRVSQSGNITFPLIGAVKVSGRSPREIETALSEQLAAGHFIRQSQVTVLVVEYQSQLVAVMGEVTKPGQYPLTGSRRVLNLLADAGGVVLGAAGDIAVLIRADGSTQQLDLISMLNGDPKDNPVLAGGDTINVPKAALFYVYGEVQKPGVYRLERNTTVSQAISAGGGLTRRGTESGALVKRRDAHGKEMQIHVMGSDLLKPDDVLMIKESWF